VEWKEWRRATTSEWKVDTILQTISPLQFVSCKQLIHRYSKSQIFDIIEVSTREGKKSQLFDSLSLDVHISSLPCMKVLAIFPILLLLWSLHVLMLLWSFVFNISTFLISLMCLLIDYRSLPKCAISSWFLKNQKHIESVLNYCVSLLDYVSFVHKINV